MLSINTVVDMPNGNYIEIDEIRWWGNGDGAVYGRIGRMASGDRAATSEP